MLQLSGTVEVEGFENCLSADELYSGKALYGQCTFAYGSLPHLKRAATCDGACVAGIGPEARAQQWDKFCAACASNICGTGPREAKR